ncbi:hypothetical protein VN97_g4054 [Penicillium thymicola]|uniref:Uncharacterized protein n=1 Tax=Penicillium thymicola TaxID=293382 RepID=A0AAI9X9P9_PENTH|nr:hypothetical protein VN97_g4054 [Penicillium thymicola]
MFHNILSSAYSALPKELNFFNHESISHCTIHFDVHHVDPLLTDYEHLETLFNLPYHCRLHPPLAPPSTPSSSSSRPSPARPPTNTYK